MRRSDDNIQQFNRRKPEYKGDCVRIWSEYRGTVIEIEGEHVTEGGRIRKAYNILK